MDSSTSRVSLMMVHMQSTAASNDASIDRAFMMASNRGELTISAAGISRSQDDIHSNRCGFEAAVAVMRSVSNSKHALMGKHDILENLREDWEYWVRSPRT